VLIGGERTDVGGDQGRVLLRADRAEGHNDMRSSRRRSSAVLAVTTSPTRLTRCGSPTTPSTVRAGV